MCNVSIKRNICVLHCSIKTTRLNNLIHYNTNLCDQLLRALEHNSFQICLKLSKSKTFNKYVIYHLISEYNYKNIFVKIESSKVSEF